MDFHNRRVTIMGLGHFGGGAAAARWLARQGAEVTVTDLADQSALADSLAALDGEPIARFHLGGHRQSDFRRADLVVVNPAVRPGNPFLKIAAECEARLTTEIGLFMEACPARIIGVTGSNGKSTTAAMTAAILQADGRRAWLGGNIGGSLLDRLDRIGPEDWVVLELSSFQLWHLGADVHMPHVAVVTGCSPNHLDWHGSYEHYVAAKQRILAGQTPDDLVVLNTQDAEVGSWGHLARGRQLPPVAAGEIPPLCVPGQHNRINAACAAAAAGGVGCGRPAIRRGLGSFRTLPQRLERAAVIDGRTFYNDSAATTPEATVAALRSLEQPVWLLAGGHDKGCDFEELATTIAKNARGAAFYGPIRTVLRDSVDVRTTGVNCTTVETMAEAFDWCWQGSRRGDAIVLSPACPSGEQFGNFRRRGEEFVKLVRALADRSEENGSGGRGQGSGDRGFGV